MSNQDTPFAMIPHWVLTDSRLSFCDRVIYAVLMTFCGKDLTCYPSHEAIAERAGCSPSTVKRALGDLRKVGAIEWARRSKENGSKASNLYKVRFEKPLDRAQPNDRSSVTNTDRSSVTNTDRSSVTKELYPLELNSIELEPPIYSPTEKPTVFDSQFAEFWEAYPRKAGKRQAEVALAKALATGVTFEAIIAGVKRYATDPNRVDQYTKHPTTWLNQGCWDDDPLPARTPPTARVGGNDIFVDIINDITAGGVLNANRGNRNGLPGIDSR